MERKVVVAVALTAAAVLLAQLGIGLLLAPDDADAPRVPGDGRPPVRPLPTDGRDAWPTPWTERRPNIVVIFVDDQNAGTMDFMPRTQAHVLGEGVTFLNAYATTPVCCPSRVSLLTGQYAIHHGTHTNFQTIRATEVLPKHLKEAGYTTAHVGKYLNTWDGRPRPEYDVWVAHEGAQSGYFDPRLNVNGVWSTHRGYITDLFADHAVAFVEDAVQRERDFALFWWPNAPHGPAQPHPDDRELYVDLPLHRPPSLNEEDVSDKPLWVQALPAVNEERARDMDSLRLRQLQVLASLDRAVDRLLDTLDRLGVADDTAVFYLSDNGILTGEHRLIDKHYAYEEAIRVPFGMRYPAFVTEPVVELSLVANIDVPATIYDITGVRPVQRVDGRSLVELLQGTEDWRDDLYLEAWPRFSPPWQAVHTGKTVYIETEGDLPELYDLHRDPFQLENLASDADHLELREAMEARLAAYRAEVGAP